MPQKNSEHGEDVLRRALDAIPHPVCIVDVGTYRILYANPAAHTMAGRSLPSTCYEFLYGAEGPCNTPDRPCPLVNNLREGKAVVVEHLRRDERPIPRTYEIHASPIFNDEGLPVYALLFIIDVSTIRMGAQEIACTDLEISSILESAPVIYMLVDQDRRIWRVNKAVYSLIPNVSQPVIGQRVGEAFRCVHAHDDPRGCGFSAACAACTVRRLVAETFERGEGLERQEVTLEIQTNGTAHTHHFFAWTSFLPNLPRTLSLIVLEDITPLREAEEEIHQLITSREHLNTITAALAHVTEMEELLEVLTSQLAAITSAEILGIWIDEHVSTKGISPESILDEILRARQLNIVPTRTLVWPPHDVLPTTVYTWLRDLAHRHQLTTLLIVPILVDEHPVGAVGLGSRQKTRWDENEIALIEAICHESSIVVERIRLIRHLQEMNALLERALQVREIVLQNVSHELRTPLTLLKGYLELLDEEALGTLTEQQKKALTVMQRHVNRLQFMVERLILMSTLHSRGLHTRRVDITSWLRQVVEDWQHQATMENVTLELDLPEAIPAVQIDADLFRQAIDNLISNAIKFSQEGGRVCIQAKCEGHHLHLTIRDNGIGIPPENLDHIFDRFYQVDAKPSRQFEGLGIGLSLVRDIVELHEGRIWAESEGLGRGATFHIVIPCA